MSSQAFLVDLVPVGKLSRGGAITKQHGGTYVVVPVYHDEHNLDRHQVKTQVEHKKTSESKAVGGNQVNG